jgi:DNA-binding response OmpR family regulator
VVSFLDWIFMGQPTHIVLVEDDPDLRSLCRRVLQRAGHEVATFEDGEAALDALAEITCDLVLLDWHLPGLSGQALMEAIGWRWPELPIIIMTGFSDENKAVAAVQYAQAYLRKPVPNDALLEAVSRVLHRSRNRPPSEPVGDVAADVMASRVSGQVAINPLQCEAHFGQQAAEALTVTEYALLNRLFVDMGQVVSHQELAEPISARPLSPREAAALCKHHIRALRTKLEPDPARPQFILTVRGQGYRLEPDPS